DRPEPQPEAVGRGGPRGRGQGPPPGEVSSGPPSGPHRQGREPLRPHVKAGGPSPEHRILRADGHPLSNPTSPDTRSLWQTLCTVLVSTRFGPIILARTLVVGGCGFLGSHVVDALGSKGHEVRVLDLQPIPSELRVAWKGVDFQKGDMLDARAVAHAVEDCDFVFHYATTTIPKTSMADPELDNQNLVATLRLIKACAAARGKKIVFPSSGGTVYGKPDRVPIPEEAPPRPGSPYAATKI